MEYFDIKSLYTIVPIEEAIEIALQELYSSDEVPEILRSAMKSFLRLVLKIVHFKINKMWYTHTDGLAMGASLAVILANLWIKFFKNPSWNQIYFPKVTFRRVTF